MRRLHRLKDCSRGGLGAGLSSALLLGSVGHTCGRRSLSLIGRQTEQLGLEVLQGIQHEGGLCGQVSV